MVVTKLNQESSLPDNKGLVTDPNEELVAELDILRGEVGTLIKDLRTFIDGLRTDDVFTELSHSELADILEEIING